MAFWKRTKQRKQASAAPDTGQVQAPRKTAKRQPPVAMGVNMLAIKEVENCPAKNDL